MSSDRFNTRAEQTYRVFLSMSINGKGSTNAQTAAPLGPALAGTFPEVVTYTRVGYFGRESPGGKVLKGDGGKDLVITGLMRDSP